MDEARLVECAFFIPRCRDRNLSDGDDHSFESWEWLSKKLYTVFFGRTMAPGWWNGLWKDPDTGERVQDQSRRYLVAVPEDKINLLRDILSEACWHFQQKTIYLSVAGYVEFVDRNRP